MENGSAQVIIRKPINGSDFGFIYSTWRNALWYAQDPKHRPDDDSVRFYKEESKKIKDLIENPDVVTRIACLKEDPDFIIGWSVVNIQNQNIEFVYVKIKYRSNGVAKILCKGWQTFTKPRTRVGLKIAKKYQSKEKQDGRKENETQGEVRREAKDETRALGE